MLRITQKKISDQLLQAENGIRDNFVKTMEWIMIFYFLLVRYQFRKKVKTGVNILEHFLKKFLKLFAVKFVHIVTASAGL